eukprot:CAMPEP_0169127152 /NCGR_PEP_ID=MMETSP1015-20121227/35849_1 /TAXON_ID=342587 /ORGANISM="Karlodinium micrum, Strain CCMP2283" /LENGTH=211 /DNA_ID=CAMNT_0009190903 /DNA_START=53 /DNA_END=685 /DNA_ORIENTATION=-
MATSSSHSYATSPMSAGGGLQSSHSLQALRAVLSTPVMLPPRRCGIEFAAFESPIGCMAMGALPPLPPISSSIIDIEARLAALEKQRQAEIRGAETQVSIGVKPEKTDEERETMQSHLQEENARLRKELSQIVRERNDLRVELENERSSMRRQSSESSYALEDLKRQLEAMTKERDLLLDDYLRTKKAHDAEQQRTKVLQAELDVLRPSGE